jgi:hypothetical protein
VFITVHIDKFYDIELTFSVSYILLTNLKLRTMKKCLVVNQSLIVLAVLIGMGPFLSSCTKKLNDPFDDTIAEFAIVGSSHMKGLDYILEDLKLNYASSPFNPSLSEMKMFIATSSANFTIATLKIKNESIWSIRNLVKSIEIPYEKSDDSPSIIDMVGLDVALTAKQYEYVVALDDLVASVSLGIDQCIGSIENLERSIYENCTANEMQLLLCATAIGKSSLLYWYENYYIWENDVISIEMDCTKTEDDRKWFWSALNRMGKADIAGGIVGGAFGALAGGVGAVPGAVAGACQASGTCGLVVIYERIFE